MELLGFLNIKGKSFLERGRPACDRLAVTDSLWRQVVQPSQI